MGRCFLPRPSAQQPHLTVLITDGDPTDVIRDSVSRTDYETVVPLSPTRSRRRDSNRRRTRPSGTRTP
jgi:hypothetical protein